MLMSQMITGPYYSIPAVAEMDGRAPDGCLCPERIPMCDGAELRHRHRYREIKVTATPRRNGRGVEGGLAAKRRSQRTQALL